MAHKNNKNHQQVQPSFFKQQEQKLGNGFINRLTSEMIRKNALRIFKDLASGAIDPEVDYKYFDSYDITYNLYLAAADNANYNYACYMGLCNTPQQLSNPNTVKIAQAHYEHYMVYQSIVVHLNNILYNLAHYNGAYTRYYLTQLVYAIRGSRRIFNGYFITISDKDTDRGYMRKERRQIPNGQGFSNQGEDGFFKKPPQNNM